MSALCNTKIHFDSEIEKLLKNVAKDEGFTDFKIEKENDFVKDDGYLGDITAVWITGKTQSEKQEKLSLIVKTASKNESVREEIPMGQVYETEIYMYNVVIPAFRRFQIEKGLPPYSSVAKCYTSSVIEKSEALVLENLKDQGYVIYNRKLPMDDSHVKLVMTEYGRFHALSFGLRDQHPEQFEKLVSTMGDIYEKFLELADFVEPTKKQCYKALESLDPVMDKHAFQRFRDFIDTEVEPFTIEVPKFVDEHSVILHGDSRMSNMMFKYEDARNPQKPTKMCLIDLQIARLGPPAFDMSYYFYSCASNEIISNWKHYLDIYYNSLSDYLKQLGLNAADVYPYSAFQEHWKKYAKYGLIYACLLIHITLRENDEVTSFSDLSESGKSATEVFDYDIGDLKEYNDRIRHVILHFVNNNLI